MNSKLTACSTDTETKLNINEIKDHNKADVNEEENKQDEPTIEMKKKSIQ